MMCPDVINRLKVVLLSTNTGQSTYCISASHKGGAAGNVGAWLAREGVGSGDKYAR